MSALLVTVGLSVAQAGMAYELPQKVGSFDNWTVYTLESKSEKECWVVSGPTTSTTHRAGEPVAVNRGEIRLFVKYDPNQRTKAEISFTGGYPYARDSTATLVISNQTFELIPGSGNGNEWAWPKTEVEATLLEALSSAEVTSVTVTGVSSRGTTTVDTISLAGFAPGLKLAIETCEVASD